MLLIISHSTLVGLFYDLSLLAPTRIDMYSYLITESYNTLLHVVTSSVGHSIYVPQHPVPGFPHQAPLYSPLLHKCHVFLEIFCFSDTAYIFSSQVLLPNPGPPRCQSFREFILLIPVCPLSDSLP